MPVYKYVGSYERFVENIGVVRPFDLVTMPAALPGWEWVPVVETGNPVKVSDSQSEPVSAPPVNNEPPAPVTPPVAVPVPVSGPVPASPPTAAVVH